METTTTTHTFTNAHDLAVVVEKLQALKDRAAKRGWGVTLTWSSSSVIVDEAMGDREFTLVVEYGGSFAFDGGWRLVAVADATATTEPLVFSFVDEDLDLGVVDMTRCDHCGRAIHRNKVLFVRSESGEIKQVGGSCSTDFVGHDPEWAFWFGTAFDTIGFVPSTYRVEDVLDAAIEAYRLGYRKAVEADSNKDIVLAMFSGKFWSHPSWKDTAEALRNAPAARLDRDEVLAWMLDQDGTGEFGSNLARIARSETVGLKVIGLAAYAPAGFDRWREKMVELAAKRAADEARLATAEDVPVTKNRIRIEGVVATVKYVENAYGGSLKMRVVTDAGWACWGSVPSSLDGESVQVGDRVEFIARIDQSEDDAKFGFFSRPTKAAIVKRAEVAA